MTNSTPPPSGLIGFLFDASREAVPAEDCQSICAMAAELRRRIMYALLKMELCPDRAVTIDGETWAPDRVISALRRLYDWTYQACRQEEPRAVAFVHSAYQCGRSNDCE